MGFAGPPPISRGETWPAYLERVKKWEADLSAETTRHFVYVALVVPVAFILAFLMLVLGGGP